MNNFSEVKMENSKSTKEHDLKEVVYQPLSQNIQPNNDNNKGDCLFLYFATFSASLAFIGIGGCVHTWPSPVIPKLTSLDDEINPLGEPINHFQISLIAGLPALGGILAPIIFGKVVDIIGGRWTTVYLSIITVISLVVLAFARTVYLYYITRFICGAAHGVLGQALPIFISEITEDHNRGKFGCFMGVFPPLGSLYVFVLGPMFSVKVFTLICAAPLVVNIIILSLAVPDSPFYLASKGNKKGAIKALKKYRNKDPSDIEKEFEKIDYILKNTTSNSSKVGFSALFATKALRRGFLIALGINMAQHFSGISAIVAYAGPIFTQADTGLAGDTVAIIIGVVKIIVLLFTSVIVEKLGRRPLLIFSSIFSAIPLFLLGLYFHLQDTGSSYINNISWLPVASVIVYVATYSTGLGPIPLAMMSEMFPNNLKSVAVSLIVFFIGCAVFIVSSGFPILAHYAGMPWCLWLFGTMCVLACIFIFFVVPETKGKSVLEIQEMLNR